MLHKQITDELQQQKTLAIQDDEYTIKLDSLAQKNDRNQEKNDAIATCNQELTERIHLLELQKNTQQS